MKTLSLAASLAAFALPANAEVKVTVLKIQEHRALTLAEPEGTKGIGSADSGTLMIEVLLEGPEVAEATHAGTPVIDKAADDTGQSLKSESTFSTDRFDKLNREHMWFMRDDAPADQIKLTVNLSPAARAAGAIRLIEGSVTLRTTETHDVLVTPSAEMVFDDEKLKASGAEVTVKSVEADSGQVQLTLNDPDDKIGDVDLVDANGESASRSRSSFGFNNRKEITVETGEAFDGSVKLKVPVKMKVTNVEVPIKLENLKLP